MFGGVFLGSAAWWLFLSTLAAMLRHRLTSGAMRTVNLVAGASILALGCRSLRTVLRVKLA